MDFVAVVDQVITLLRQRGCVTYRTFQRQLQLDEEALADLLAELRYAYRNEILEEEQGVLWVGEARSALPASAAPATPTALVPRTYTPAYLSEQILTSRSALEGERKPAGNRAVCGPQPLYGEDHAVRACYAALAMQEAMQSYAEEGRRTQGLLVQMRVGLNSGEVVVRAIGNDLHMDYSAVGQTTHLAARMEQLAAPGSILLTAATLRLVEGLVRVQALVPVPVKGLAEPVEVFELVGVTALRRRLQAAVARGLSPFVGRQPELEALQQALTRAGAGQGQVVSLLGEPGVGKSRLVYEFLHSHHTQGWLVLESSSVSYGKATAYLPVCDLLRAYCHIGDRDDLRTVRAKIAGHILTLDEALQDTVPTVLALFEALPVDSPFLHGEAPARTLDHLRRAETLVQTLGDRLRLGWVYATMNNHFWVLGDVDRAIDYGQRALALVATLGHVGLGAWAHFSLGRIYYDTGDYTRAIESFERNVAALHGELLHERFGTNGSVVASSRAWLSYCLAERGAFTEGLAMAEDGLRIAETVNHPFRMVEACSGVSMVYLRRGELHRAVPVLERGMSLCQDWHIPLLLPMMAAALGLAYALDGRVAAGLALAEHGVEQVVARGIGRNLVPVVILLSEAYLLVGHLEEGRQRAEQALDLACQYQLRGNQARALWLLGESTARQASPEVEPATGHYRQALALAEELGMRPLQAHCHRGLGTLYARQGQQEQARTALSTAIVLYRAMDMRFWLPQAEITLAQVV